MKDTCWKWWMRSWTDSCWGAFELFGILDRSNVTWRMYSTGRTLVKIRNSVSASWKATSSGNWSNFWSCCSSSEKPTPKWSASGDRSSWRLLKSMCWSKSQQGLTSHRHGEDFWIINDKNYKLFFSFLYAFLLVPFICNLWTQPSVTINAVKAIVWKQNKLE